jgi:hypothetical protein
MANKDNLNGSEQEAKEISRQSPNGGALIELQDDEGSGGILESYFVLLALRNRRLLIISALCMMALVFVLTEFVMHKKYQAQAMIRPVSGDSSGLSGLLQSTGLMQGNSTIGNGIAGPPDPNELVAILQSYSFTTSMVEQEHLTPRLLKGSRSLSNLIPFLSKGTPTPFSMYRLMSSRFDCDFSIRDGNMTLTFIDKDPELARTILDLYISRLRNQVRAQTVRDTKAALSSLEEEVVRTADPLLRDSMYQLIALQMQQVKTAKANSDFAFTVIEPPFVPPYPYAPSVILDTLVAGVLVSFMAFCGLVVRDYLPRLRRRLAEIEGKVVDAQDVPAPAKKPPRSVPIPEQDRPYSL